MKIGIIVPSIYMSDKKERVFALRNLGIDLADGLVDLGHKVWLFGTDDMKTKAISIGGNPVLEEGKLIWWKLRNEVGPEKRNREKQELYNMHKFDLICKAIELGNKEKFDIMHYFYETDPTHMLQRFAKYPFIYTLHDPMPEVGSLEYWYHSTYKTHKFVAISNNQKNYSTSGIKFVSTIYNGINLDDFAYCESPTADYMSYMNRFIPEKNPQEAIKLSLDMKMPIKIGGLGRDESKGKREYFSKYVKPFVDGKNVIVVDYLHGQKKAEFLGNAKFNIFPLIWEEPFGLIMTESMACGTPVIAYNRGSVSELVVDGETGFVVKPEDGYTGLVKAYKKMMALSKSKYQQMRENCRSRVAKNFTSDKMILGYEKAFNKVIEDYKSNK